MKQIANYLAKFSLSILFLLLFQTNSSAICYHCFWSGYTTYHGELTCVYMTGKCADRVGPSTQFCIDPDPLATVFLHHSSNGQAFININGENFALLSDAGYKFLTKLNKKYSTFKGTTESIKEAMNKEMYEFLKSDKGIVSEKSLKEFSKIEGIPIKTIEGKIIQNNLRN